MSDKAAHGIRTGLVSVVMPVYNVREYLDEAVNSVLAQSYDHWELILIDDGSTDGSGEACDRYARLDPRIRVFHQENRGVSGARNAGMKLAEGEFLQFMDSDDWLFPEALERCVKTARDESANLVIFDALYELGNKSMHEKSRLAPGIYDNKTVLEAVARPVIPPYAGNKFCKRELYDGVTFPEGELWEDAGTTYLPISRARRIAVLGKPLYHYRQRDDAISKRAVRDKSIYYWRYKQYKKRYEFLKGFDPAIAKAAKKNVLRSGMMWCALAKDKAQKDVREARAFLLSPEMDGGAEDVETRTLRLLFRVHPGIFLIAVKAGSVLFKKPV